MTLSTRGLKKQALILDAAENLFLRLGLRGATMETLAKDAGVAKATLYGYFPDKEAVFAGVLTRFHARLEQVVMQNLDQDAATVDRVTGALVEKARMVFRLLQGSPHADELLAGKKTLYQDQPNLVDQWVIDLLVPVLAQDHSTRAPVLASLLLACTHGIAGRAQNESELAEGIRAVVRAVLTQDRGDHGC